MNILKTEQSSQKLLAESFSGTYILLKSWQILIDNCKSEQNPLKVLKKEVSFGKDTGLQTAFFPKNEIHYRCFPTNLSTLCLQLGTRPKSSNREVQM